MVTSFSLAPPAAAGLSRWIPRKTSSGVFLTILYDLLILKKEEIIEETDVTRRFSATSRCAHRTVSYLRQRHLR